MRSVQWHPCPSVPHKPATVGQRAPKTRRGRKIMHTPPAPPSPPQVKESLGARIVALGKSVALARPAGVAASEWLGVPEQGIGNNEISR
jgi:hypothetical protein